MIANYNLTDCALKLMPIETSRTGLTQSMFFTTAKADEPKEIIVKAVKELHCPNCNAPIKLKETDSGRPLTQNCEYCGTLLSFQID